MNDASFPTADVRAATSLGKSSKLWWLTAACLLVAAVLVWSSMKPAGKAIEIWFDDGHGLKVADKIRHRGIEIGHVVRIRLADDLSGIQVEAILDRDAASVACEGSRFWIVRPQIDVSGVSGLDTAVGAKYIRVIPAANAKTNDAKPQNSFRGLASQPADEDGFAGGLELVLRAEQRHGVHASAPVTWRGIPVGRVLSTSLSPDASRVDVRVRIDEGYRRLIRSSSVFWVTSGIDIDLGVTGMEVSAESLATIVRGGIAVITLGNDNGSEVQQGDVFALRERGEDEWLEQAVPINLITMEPVETVRVITTWQESFLGIARDQKDEASAWVSLVDDQPHAIMPAEILIAPPSAVEGSFQIAYEMDDKRIPIEVPDQLPRFGDQTSPLAKLDYPTGIPLPGGRVVMPKRLRVPDGIEDCFVVRGEGQSATMQWLGRESLTRGDQGWNVSIKGLSRGMWNGTPVMAATDQRLIGVLWIDASGAQVVPLP